MKLVNPQQRNTFLSLALSLILTGVLGATESESRGAASQADPASDAASEEVEDRPFFTPVSLKSLLQPAPFVAPRPLVDAAGPMVSPPAAQLSARLFGEGQIDRSLLSVARRTRVYAPGTDLVFGSEGKFRVTTDAGSLLGKSLSARGVTVQPRTPIVNDPRIRGDRIGRLSASGSYWIPARQDLDTMLSKIDSRIIGNMIVIKGPYSVSYGPGFDFVDFQLLPSPRYCCGYQSSGSTSFDYKTNGEQVYGRTSVWGGSDNWGYRVGYGHGTGNDYDTGDAADGSFFQPTSLPTSYNSRNFDLTIGYDPSPNSQWEFTYLRLDQTGVEFPGLVFDINYLKTDAFELKYTEVNQPQFDRFVLEGWYNQTVFAGDTFRIGKNRQIPSLRLDLVPFGLGAPGNAITDVEALSTGGRFHFTWGEPGDPQATVGADAIIVTQALNDIEDPTGAGIFPPFVGPFNNPIPRSTSTDVGIFFDTALPITDRLTINGGTRVDFVSMDARDVVPGLRNTFVFPFAPITVSQLKQSGLEQSFTPWAVFSTAEYEISPCWTTNAAVGYAERPPSLTELYASGSFIGSLQPGLTAVDGDPELDPERRIQFDLGIQGTFGPSSVSLNGYYAWIRDFITFDHISGPTGFGYVPGQDFQRSVFTNTDLATLAGFEIYAELLLTPNLTVFGTSSYVEGRDLSRMEPSRLGAIYRPLIGLGANDPRSVVVGTDHEPLPNIPPLDTILGLRLHQPGPNSRWGAELSARIVDNQDRLAMTLSERATPGFTIWNLRGFWQATDRLLLIAGVENFGDKFYREHLDYRSGRGVYQPGANFYFLSELTY